MSEWAVRAPGPDTEWHVLRGRGALTMCDAPVGICAGYRRIDDVSDEDNWCCACLRADAEALNREETER